MDLDEKDVFFLLLFESPLSFSLGLVLSLFLPVVTTLIG
jgi:hypothetical protein